MANNRPVHVLVIRLSAMGDVSMTVPVILGIVTKYPEVKITILTKSFTSPIFDNVPNVAVYIADIKHKHKGVRGLWKLYKELKGIKIDCVADLHNVLRSSILKLFFRCSSIPFIQLDKGRKEKKNLINPRKTVFEPLKTTFERYAEVFEKLGFPIFNAEMKTLSRTYLPASIRELGVPNGKVLIGIAPFAAYKGKMYPINLMEEVVQHLNISDTYQIMLFGGGSKEIETLAAWSQKFKNTCNVAGKVSFSDEISLISNLQLMLAMDSGNAHLAAMFGVPTVTIWGVTHPYAGFYPFGQPESNAILADRNKFPFIPTSIYGNKYPEGYDTVMETIRPTTVVAKIQEVLKVSI